MEKGSLVGYFYSMKVANGQKEKMNVLGLMGEK